MRRIGLFASMLAMLLVGSAVPTLAADQAVTVYAAGSLRGAMTALAAAFEKQAGIPVKVTFGPSGVLRGRIEGGERPDILASADIDSPEALARAGLSLPTILYARNELCATGKQSLGLTSHTLLDRLLDPAVRLGTSTPKADPAGDYAWQMFKRAEAVRPGSAKALDAKADQIVGGPNNSAPVGGKHPVAAAFASDKIDVFLGYCSGDLHKTEPGLVQVQLPPELAVGAAYGMGVLKQAGPGARAFALYVVSLAGQSILRDHGFVPVGLP